jgi:hypothetical protein
MIALLIITSLNPITTKAEPDVRPTCDQVLQACDKALKDQIKLGNDQKVLIQSQEELIDTQRVKIDELTKDNNSLLKNPWLWFGVGLATGVVILKK